MVESEIAGMLVALTIVIRNGLEGTVVDFVGWCLGGAAGRTCGDDGDGSAAMAWARNSKGARKGVMDRVSASARHGGMG